MSQETALAPDTKCPGILTWTPQPLELWQINVVRAVPSVLFVTAAWTDKDTCIYLSFCKKCTLYNYLSAEESQEQWQVSSGDPLGDFESGLRTLFSSLRKWHLMDSRSGWKICWGDLWPLVLKSKSCQKLQRSWPRDRGNRAGATG